MGFAPEWDFVDIQIIVSTKYPDCVFPYYVFVVIFFFVVCLTRVSFKHPLSVCLWYSVIFVLIALTLILSLFSGLFVPPACARVSLKHPQGRLYGRVQLRTKGVHHLWNKVSGLYCFAFKVAQVGWSLKVLGDWGTDRRGPMPRSVGLWIAHLVDDELGLVNPLIRSIIIIIIIMMIIIITLLTTSSVLSTLWYGAPRVRPAQASIQRSWNNFLLKKSSQNFLGN